MRAFKRFPLDIPLKLELQILTGNGYTKDTYSPLTVGNLVNEAIQELSKQLLALVTPILNGYDRRSIVSGESLILLG